MQNLIGENFAKLDVAQKDQQFVQFQQKSYDEVLMALEKHIRVSRDTKDLELEQHYKDLDKFGLRSAGWITEPLDNVEHDFFSELVEKYLDDLEVRKGLGNSENSPFVEILRKTVLLDEMSGVVN